jgi:Flp pilus assembly protein CpaB
LWRLARRGPLLYWTATATLAVVTGLTTVAVTRHAGDELAAWGDDEVVAVAQHDLAPGTALGAGDVGWEPRPIAVLPDAVIVDGTPVEGRVVTVAVHRGEALVDDRLAPGGTTGLPALMPAHTRAVTIPASDRQPPVHVDDHVDVWRGGGGAGSDQPAAALIARSATVVDTGDDGRVTVAVQPDEAGAMAAAVVEGSVVLTVTNR